jgi:hypothetical protein
MSLPDPIRIKPPRTPVVPAPWVFRQMTEWPPHPPTAGFVVQPGTTFSADAVIPGTGNWDSASGSTPEEALARLEDHLRDNP